MSDIVKINPVQITKNVFDRYNLVIFIVLVAGVLIVYVLLLTSILSSPGDSTSDAQSTFDQATISRLNQFETSSKNTNYRYLPTGRINPFFE